MTDSSVVIDASIAIKSITPDPLQDACAALLHQLRTSEIIVPSLFAYETTSVLTKIVHFGQLTPAEGRILIGAISQIEVEFVVPDQGLSLSAYDWTLRLGRAAAYDSYYLALAESLDCDLWTADRRLANQLSASWVHWVGDHD